MSIPVLRQLFDQMDWANRRVWKALLEAPNPNPDAVQLLTHNVLAERNWLKRIHGEFPPSSVGVTLPLNEIEEQMNRNRAAFQEMLSTITEEGLDGEVVFRNAEGAAQRFKLRDIMLQLATHGFYHRGQIARIIRQSGSAPAETGYIAYVREKTASPTKA